MDNPRDDDEIDSEPNRSASDRRTPAGGDIFTMTNKRYPKLTRRNVLTSVGAAGVGGYGFLRFRGASLSDGDTQYTNYTLAETQGPRLLVGWYSTYNGRLRSGAPTDGDVWEFDSTDRYVDGVDAVLSDRPAVDASNLLPGDSGTLSVGLYVAPDSESARIWMRLESESGPLGEEIPIRAWYDTGIFGIGGCQGAENGTATDPITPEDATVADPGQLADGLEINPGIFDNGRIDPGDRICIALAWSFPVGVGNDLQDESASFDLTFVAVEADNPTNPFEGGL